MDELWMHPGNPGAIFICAGQDIENGELQLVTVNGEEAAKRIPQIAREAAISISPLSRRGNYGAILVRKPQVRHKDAIGFGLLQDRVSWRDNADINIIGSSLLDLEVIANSLPNCNFRVEMPGDLNTKPLVEKMIERKPRNVTYVDCFTMGLSVRQVFDTLKGLVMEGNDHLAKEYIARLNWEDVEEQFRAAGDQVRSYYVRHPIRYR